MSIFDIAKQQETRDAFVAAKAKSLKYKEEELAAIKEYVLGGECERDIDRLAAGDYFLDPPQYRLIPKNFNDRKRAIYKFPGTQGTLIKLLVFAMRDIEKHYSDRLFSFRSDKTATDLLFEIRANKEISSLYVLKTDVSNYVGSIVPALLLPMLAKLYLPDDPAFYSFLEWLLTRNKVINIDGDVIDHCPGGMGGVPFGNVFMDLYLHEMDDYYENRAAFYSRYSDDILICARTREEIEAFEQFFYDTLERLQLHTNKDKTMILEPGEAFELLGMELCNGKVSISRHSMEKIKRKIRKFTDRALKKRNRKDMTPDEAARMLIVRYNRFFFGYSGNRKLLSWARWAFPVINDTECLREIDHYFQNSVRYVLYGSMKKRNRSIPYKKLRELGYRSIVYYYHHQDKISQVPELMS